MDEIEEKWESKAFVDVDSLRESSTTAKLQTPENLKILWDLRESIFSKNPEKLDHELLKHFGDSPYSKTRARTKSAEDIEDAEENGYKVEEFPISKERYEELSLVSACLNICKGIATDGGEQLEGKFERFILANLMVHFGDDDQIKMGARVLEEALTDDQLALSKIIAGSPRDFAVSQYPALLPGTESAPVVQVVYKTTELTLNQDDNKALGKRYPQGVVLKKTELWSDVKDFKPVLKRDNGAWIAELDPGIKGRFYSKRSTLMPATVTILTPKHLAGRQLVIDKEERGFLTGAKELQQTNSAKQSTEITATGNEQLEFDALLMKSRTKDSSETKAQYEAHERNLSNASTIVAANASDSDLSLQRSTTLVDKPILSSLQVQTNNLKYKDDINQVLVNSPTEIHQPTTANSPPTKPSTELNIDRSQVVAAFNEAMKIWPKRFDPSQKPKVVIAGSKDCKDFTGAKISDNGQNALIVNFTRPAGVPEGQPTGMVLVAIPSKLVEHVKGKNQKIDVVTNSDGALNVTLSGSINKNNENTNRNSIERKNSNGGFSR